MNNTIRVMVNLWKGRVDDTYFVENSNELIDIFLFKRNVCVELRKIIETYLDKYGFVEHAIINCYNDAIDSCLIKYKYLMQYDETTLHAIFDIPRKRSNVICNLMVCSNCNNVASKLIEKKIPIQWLKEHALVERVQQFLKNDLRNYYAF